MGKNFLSVFGHTTLDHIIEVPSFPEPNTSIEVVAHEVYRGGTGANIAFMVASLGVPVALASFVGEDFPEHYDGALRAAGVDTQDLKKVRGFATPTCWIMTDPDQNQVAVIDQGPMRVAAKFPVARRAVDTCERVHICTGRPEYYSKVISYARSKRKSVSFDPGQELHYVYTPKMFEWIIAKSDIFFANESEGKKALKYLGLRTTRQLLDYVPTLVLTMGKKGSRIVTEDCSWNLPTVPGDRFVDPTGAGDAYRAGFYAGLHRGMGTHDAGLAGASAASFVVEAKGCQTNPPTWEALEQRLRKRGLRFEGC